MEAVQKSKLQEEQLDEQQKGGKKVADDGQEKISEAVGNDMEKRWEKKIKNQEITLRNQNRQIEEILDEYSVNKKTLGQATKSLLSYDIAKWAKRQAPKEEESKGGAPAKSKNVARVKGELGFKPDQFTPSDAINKVFNNDFNKLNLQLEKFASDLFYLWDTKSYGKIKLSELVKNFLYLGFINKEDMLFKVLAP